MSKPRATARPARWARPVLQCLEARALLDGAAPAAMGAMGDSFTALYNGRNGNPNDHNWVEQLAVLRGISFGPTAPASHGFGSYVSGEFSYDVAPGGPQNAYDAEVRQAPALVNDVAQGAPIQAASLEIGAHDFSFLPPNMTDPAIAAVFPSGAGLAPGGAGGIYGAIYGGYLTGDQLRAYSSAVVNSIISAATQAHDAGIRMVVANLPDFGDAPYFRVQLGDTDPTGIARVNAALNDANANLLEPRIDSLGIPLLDIKGLIDLSVSGQPLVVGGFSVNTSAPPSHYPGYSVPADTSYFWLDYLHPGTIASGLYANMVIEALDGSYGYNIAPLTDQEILGAAGITPPAEPTSYFDVRPFVHQVDQVAPTSALVNLPAPTGQNGWSNGPVTVTLDANDNRFGSGVAAVQYSIDGGKSWAVASPTGTLHDPGAPYGADGSPEFAFTLSADGVYDVLYRAVDAAGNTEAAHALPTIRIDQTPPVSVPVVDQPTLWPPNGRTVPVTVSGVITDNLSGVDPAGVTYTVTDSEGAAIPGGSVTLSGDGSYWFRVPLVAARADWDTAGRVYTITVSDDDVAGNLGRWSVTVKVPHDQGSPAGGTFAAAAPLVGSQSAVDAWLTIVPAETSAGPLDLFSTLAPRRDRPTSVLLVSPA